MSRNFMSRAKKPSPRPSWAWSGVVLLSTLLLSPVASAHLLSALGRVLPFASASRLPAQMPPRRSPDEEEAARVLLHSVLGERDAETEAESKWAEATASPTEAGETDAPKAECPDRFPFPAVPPFATPPFFSPARTAGLPTVFVGLRACRAPPV